MTCFVGDKTEYPGTQSFSSDATAYAWGFRVYCHFTVTHMTAWGYWGGVDKTNYFRCAIYDSRWTTALSPDQWLPNNLLTQTDPFRDNSGTTTYVTVPFLQPVVLVPGAYYWLAGQGQNVDSSWAQIRKAISGDLTYWRTYDNTVTWAGGFNDPWTTEIIGQADRPLTWWFYGPRVSAIAGKR